MITIEQVRERLEGWEFVAGAGSPSTHTACALTALAVVEGRTHEAAHPCPVLQALALTWSDAGGWRDRDIEIEIVHALATARVTPKLTEARRALWAEFDQQFKSLRAEFERATLRAASERATLRADYLWEVARLRAEFDRQVEALALASLRAALAVVEGGGQS
jgi:hypothetical protein